NVDPDKIARAIFAGFQSELQAQDAGLIELQFPVGRGAQGLLFGPVQDDLTQAAPPPGRAPKPVRAPIANMFPGPKTDPRSGDDDDDGDGVELRPVASQASSNSALGRVVVDARAGQSGQQAITNENSQFQAAVAGGNPPQNYDVLPANPNKSAAQPGIYEGMDQPLDGPSQPEQGTATTPTTQSQTTVVPKDQPGASNIDDDASESASQNDQQGCSICCKAVIAISAVAIVLGTVGTLLWAYVFGGATKKSDSGTGTTGSGPGKLDTSDQTVTKKDLDATVDVDLPSLNKLMMVDNITFSTPTFTPPPAQGSGGSWSMTPSIHALFTPDKGQVGAFSSISVQYVLEATIQGSKVKSDARTLTVNFTPSPAVDINVTANDRTSKLPIDMSMYYSNFAGTIKIQKSTGGTWVNDADPKIVNYTPDAMTGTTATAQYERVTTWGAASANSATITVTVPAVVNPPQPTGTAEFLPNDAKTQGDWLHVYGADGYLIAGDKTSNPSYVTPTLSTQTVSSLSSTTTGIPLVKASDPTKNIAAAWSATSPVTIDLACSDSTTVHQVALYFADYDPKAGGQTVDALDAKGTKLATQTLPATLTGGLYLVCNISGHVQLQISNAAGNATLSGIFFGGPVVSAAFAKSDTKSQGTWPGVYGADGYTIAGDQTKNPSYVTPSIYAASSGPPQTPFVQAASTSEVRALEKSSKPADHIAGTWYADARGGSDSLLIDLPFSDTAVHQVAIYCLDWDNSGIVQTVDVLDPSGFVLDTQKLSSFGNGIWLVWKMMGHVHIRIRNSAGDNGTVSGVFFDPPPAMNMTLAAFSAPPAAWDFTVWMTDAPQTVKVDFLKRCQIPAGFKSIEFANGTSDVTVPKQGRWSLESTGTPPAVVFQPEVGLALTQGYSMKYRVVDQNGLKSNEATMTVDYAPLARMMPRAGNFLSSADPRYGKFAAAEVLTGCSAAFGIAKGTVKLMGLQDILQGNPQPQAYLRNDSKSMCVVGEGIWMVDDNDLIVFQSDPNLSYPPTPARFCFTDSKGYQSNVAVVVFDSSLTDALTQVPQALGKMTDADFWKNYAANVIPASSDPPPEQFIAITQMLAVITRTFGSVGPEPDYDFNTNYDQWSGGSWADLQTICAKMVASAIGNGAPQFAARYWQLNLMVRMALKAYPPS
ncbi:MAG TPA: hypothetical protein VHE33_15835, partial [Acidobacteriaceae bacterium]|nr:hypothetical protein [Acidobacteriaceae bacterium]